MTNKNDEIMIRWDSDKHPSRCPYCKSENIAANLMPENDEIDIELAFHCTGEVIEWFNNEPEFFSFHYAQAEAECDNCNIRWSYGTKWYYDQETNAYWLTREEVCLRYPNTQESMALTRQQEIEAGQLELPIGTTDAGV